MGKRVRTGGARWLLVALMAIAMLLGTAAAAYGVSGTVYGPDGLVGLEGIEVMVQDTTWMTDPYFTLTGEDGTYDVTVPLGPTYYVEFHPDAYNAMWGTFLAGQGYPFFVAGDAMGVDVTLQAASGISGFVTSESGFLNGIEVYAYDLGGNWVGSATTDAMGEYQITGLSPGDYVVLFDPWMYNDSWATAYVAEFYDDVTLWDDATPVTVYEGSVSADINAQLGIAGAGGDISGLVIDESGTPLEGIRVTAWGVGDYGWYETSTDGSGNYTFSGLSADMSGYEVFFDPSDYNTANDTDLLGEFFNDAYDYWNRTLVQPGWSGVDATLEQGGRITGTVTDAFGQPAPGVQVAAQDWGDYYVDAWTDANGDYTIHGTYPDKTVYVAFDPGLFNLDNGTNYLSEWWDNVYDSDSAMPITGTASGIDAQLDVAVSLSGTVTDMMTGGPVSDVEVQVTDYDSGGWYGSASTDIDGAYSLNVPPNVDVRIYFYAYDSNWMNGTEYLSLFYNGSYMFDGAFRVSVGTDPVTVNQALPTGTSITGTVTVGGMQPMGYVNVEAYLQVDGVSAYSAWTQTAWDGTYDFGPLVPGEWKVRFFDYVYDDGANPPAMYFGEWWDDKADEASADLVWLDEYGDAVCDADLTGLATVSGRVVDDYGMPVPGAIVTAWGADDMSGYDPGMSGYAGMGSYWTDADGYFVGAAGRTGEVKIQVEPPYERPELLSVWYSEKYDFDSADPVPVIAGEDTSLGDIVLHRGGSISGMVTDELGNPLDGIWVNLYGQTAGMSDYYRGAYTMSGYYEFTGLPAMQAELEFWPGEHNDMYDADLLGEHWNDIPLNGPDEPTLLDVLPGVDLTADAELATGARIAGVVLNEAGDPVPSVSVNANTSDGWGYGFGYTNENGEYAIRGLYPGSYQVSFEPWDYNWINDAHLLSEFYNDAHRWEDIDWVDVAVGAPRLDIDATLEEGGWIEGSVTDGGIPLAGVQVDVIDVVTGDYVGSGHTGFEGTYSTSAIAEGDYLVRFDPWEQNDVNGTGYIFEYYDDARDEASASPVTVNVGNATPAIDADLEVGGSLSGVVKDEFDMPLWGVTITAYDANGQYAGETWADPDFGEWTIKALVPGDYTLEFNPWMKNLEHGTSYLREYWNDRATRAEADPIAVDLGDVLTGYDAQLVQGGGTIAGTITGPAGAPLVSDVWVHMLEQTADGAEWFAYDAALAPDGAFSISGVPAGTYYLWFEPDWMDYVDQVYDGKPMAGDAVGQSAAIARLATPIELADGQVRDDLAIEMQTGSTVSGSVVDLAAAGIPGVDVEIFYSDGAGGWVPVQIDTTDALGGFTFSRLLAGDYKVEYADGQAWYLDAADVDTADTVVVAANSDYTLDPQQLPLPETDPPTTTLTVTGGSLGQNDWYLSAPTLTLEADEPATIWYQWDGGMPLLYLEALTPPAGGHTLTYWSVDLQGNEEDPHQSALFKFDDTAPSAPTNVTAAQSGALQATVSWTAATDAQSGIQRYVLYRWNGIGWDVVAHTIPSTSTSYVVTGLAGGVQTFRVAAVNMPGLSANSSSADATIDVTAPTTTISVDPASPNGQNGWYTQNPKVTLSADESPATILYNFGGADTEYTAPFFVGAGAKTLTVHSVDQWGNTESPGQTRDFKTDLASPTAPTNVVATALSTTQISLTWTSGTDALSGFAQDSVRDAADDSHYAYVTGGEYVVDGLEPDTEYSFYILTMDNAGWLSGESQHVTARTLPLNTAPVAGDDTYDAWEDGQLLVAAPGLLGNDTDAEPGFLTATRLTDPSHGAVSVVSDGSFMYTPTAGYVGTDSFTYTATDSGGLTDTATVTITVKATADATVALDDTYTGSEDTVISSAAPGVLGNDTDSDGLALSATVDTDVQHGTLELLADGSFTYTPNADFFGEDSFTYTAGDGFGENDTATVTITVTPVNDLPTAVDDSYTMVEDSVLTVVAPGVLGNDTDVESDPLEVSQYMQPTHGTVNVPANGGFTYTPEANWFGTDTFSYRAHDGVAASGWATVTITVTDVPEGLTVNPIEGTNRVGTAIKASIEAFADGSVDTVVIATATNWPDALGGASLAGAVKGPILLTNTNALPGEVLTEIDRLGAGKAYILGGPAAVGSSVEAALKAKLGATNVTRLAGTGRYETARKIAAECVRVLGTEYDGTAFLATGANFPDALGASPLAAAKGWPIYLVNPAAGADATLVSAMKADGVTDALVLGGTGVVAERVRTDVAAKVPCTATRLAGDNRYDTAVVIATYGVDNARLGWDKVAIATGANFPDALAGGVLQGTSGSVMLLTPQNSLYGRVASTLTANKGDIHEIRFLGGKSAVSDAVRTAAVNALK